MALDLVTGAIESEDTVFTKAIEDIRVTPNQHYTPNMFRGVKNRRIGELYKRLINLLICHTASILHFTHYPSFQIQFHKLFRKGRKELIRGHIKAA